jgi:GT2 family glycosyltransferase
MGDPKPYPLVSIVSVNYNTDKITAELLRSLRQVTYPNLEILIVDNASATDAGYLAKQFPEIKFIQNTKNEGFAGGNNRGIVQASGEVLLLLNNDTEVEPGFIEPIIELFRTDARIGIISSKIRYFNSPGTIQYAGGEQINTLTARGKFIGTGEQDHGQYDQPHQTYLAHGAAMAIRRSVFNRIGLLPEVYFLYYEELDFCEHAQRAGFTIWYQPQSLVLHKESMSVGKISALKVYYQNRNRLLFIRRNVFGLKGLLSRLFFTFVSAPAGMLKFLFQRKPQFALEIGKGLVWNLRHKSGAGSKS